MSKVVWKFPLNSSHKQDITMPKGAKILSVADQDGTVCLWALVDPNEALRVRTIITRGTGHEFFEEPGRYIGTVLIDGFVWHFFEEE